MGGQTLGPLFKRAQAVCLRPFMSGTMGECGRLPRYRWEPFCLAMRLKTWLALAIFGEIIGNAAWDPIKVEIGNTGEGSVSLGVDDPKQ